MKNIRIGVVQLTPGWQIILSQIGVNFRQLSKNSSVDPDEYSLLVVNSAEYNLELLQKWFEVDGAILWEADAYCQLNNFPLKRKRIKFVVPKAKFKYLGIIDFYCDFIYPCDSSLHFEDRKLSIAQKEGMVCLPFKLDDLILNTSVMRKRFYANRLELPSEQVSKVSKGKIRKIVQQLIEELHYQQNLPFVHKWFFPRDTQNVFIFRIDTDFCSQKDADEMYKICRENNIRATWFLDTESESRLQNYSKMEDQEMALHCERHLVFDDYERNSNNLKTALSKLEKADIEPNGFAAPFGEWNPALAQVLEDMNFAYSSEFTLDYDDLPFFPFLKDGFSAVLQIPIHPISSGRLRRSHFSEEEMLEYYRKHIEAKQNEPIIIYHHPHHHHFKVFDEVFKIINKKKFHNITMSEYSSWWKKRSQVKMDLKYDGNEIISENPKESIYLRISTKDGDAVTNMNHRILLSKLDLKQPEKIIQPEKIERIRKKHWRDLLYNYESRRRKSKK